MGSITNLAVTYIGTPVRVCSILKLPTPPTLLYSSVTTEVHTIQECLDVAKGERDWAREVPSVTAKFSVKENLFWRTYFLEPREKTRLQSSTINCRCFLRIISSREQHQSHHTVHLH